TNTDGTTATKASGFTYGAPPTITSLSPTTGPIAGGTSITINGTNFRSGATVKFGANTATNIVVSSSTKITCKSPAGTAGATNVVVTNSDATTVTKTGGFTYQ